jgi:hypothetical protein
MIFAEKLSKEIVFSLGAITALAVCIWASAADLRQTNMQSSSSCAGVQLDRLLRGRVHWGEWVCAEDTEDPPLSGGGVYV